MSSLASTRVVAASPAWQRAAPFLLAAPLIAYMLVFYALPVVAMLLRSVTEPRLTLDNYVALAGDTVFQLQRPRLALAEVIEVLVLHHPADADLAGRGGDRLERHLRREGIDADFQAGRRLGIDSRRVHRAGAVGGLHGE